MQLEKNNDIGLVAADDKNDDEDARRDCVNLLRRRW